MTATEIMFLLLRYELMGTKISKDAIFDLNENVLREILTLSKKHDIAHIVGKALSSVQAKDYGEVSKEFEKAQIFAVFRGERMTFGLKKVCSVLEDAKIDFVLLKGAVLRSYYSAEWLRTSADIDVLVHENDLPSAVKCFTEIGYKATKKGSHDVSLYGKNGLHIEIHYTLNDAGYVEKSYEAFNSPWEFAVQKKGYVHCYEFSDEMLYAYHIAHMAKHFEAGGCGIKPFIDLWILNNIKLGDKEKRERILKRGGLAKFALCAEGLSRVWFDCAKHTELTSKMEEYVLNGGVYGTKENLIFLQQQKKGGKAKYLLSKIFLSYDILKFHYPVLQKHRILTPIMQVRRWFKLLFCGHLGRVSNTIRYSAQIDNFEAASMKSFLNEIGL